MSFSFDYYKKIKQSKMFLYKSQNNPIGCLSGAQGIKLTKNFSDLFELNFTIFKNINNEETEYYDHIVKNKLIELRGINWFQILSANEKFDDNSKETYKEVKCCPLENSLIYRKIYDVDGVYTLYDMLDTEHSLLHIISNECGWHVGHVSNSLLGKWRTFSIDSMQIYNLLTTKISESFECVIKFNSYDKTISAYKLDEIGENTDIIISKKNVLREYIKDDGSDAIITKMRVCGGDDGNGGNLDIRAVNLGRDYLVNLDYFMNEDWCSSSLVYAYNVYRMAYDIASSQFTATLSTLKNRSAELTVLKSELVDLESEQNAQYVVWQPLAQKYNGAPPVGSPEYTVYINALNSYNSFFSSINSKKNAISNKENAISSLQTELNSISNGIAESNYFTSDQLTERNNFICEGDDFEDETYSATSNTPEEEVLEIQTELMLSADSKLAIVSKPQYTFSIKASNLFTIKDDKDELISYNEYIDKFDIGNFMTLFIDNSWMTVRLMSMTIDFDNPEDIDLKFSNKNRLDDELLQFAELIADAGRTASVISLKGAGYDAASKQTSQVREFMNGSLNATLNSYKSNNNVDMLFDEFGLHGRRWLPDQNKYDDRQSWFNNNGILLTSNGWVTASTALGLLVAPDGNSYYGLNTEVLVGSLIMSERMILSNASGVYTINDNGWKSTYGNNTVTINPRNSNEIFSIAVGGVNKLYVDVVTNRLVFSGALQAATGTFSGALSAATGTFSGQITGGSLNINGNCIINSSGFLTATGATFTDGSFSVTNGTNSVNINATSGIEVLKGTTKQFYIDTNGNAVFAGNITGATITGSTFSRTVSSIEYTAINNNGFFQYASGSVAFQVAYNGDPGYIYSNGTYLRLGNFSGHNIYISSTGIFATSLTVNTINGGTPLTTSSLSSISTLYSSTEGVALVTSHNYNFRAHSAVGDNSVSCGSPSYRWTNVYAASPTISTSDENEKTMFSQITDAEKRVAKKIKDSILSFRFKDAVSSKGNNARIHFGVTAQNVKMFFEEEGLDATRYAMFCSDTWYEKDGKTEDDDGKLYTVSGVDVVEKTRLGIRYEELLCFVLSSS